MPRGALSSQGQRLTTVQTMDPDWTPYGTSFGVNWSPWYETGGTRTCLLSFVDRNYLGFRRISIKGEWTRGEIPDVDIANSDSYGRCIHLSTDAFVEFEEEVRGTTTAITCCYRV